jgi:hypothetical protein
MIYIIICNKFYVIRYYSVIIENLIISSSNEESDLFDADSINSIKCILKLIALSSKRVEKSLFEC